METLEYALIEAPVVPDGNVLTGDGAVPVVAFPGLPPGEQERLIPDPELRAAAIHSGVAGVTTWPGAERWKRSVTAGESVPAIVHNTFVVSRLAAMDAIADPDHPYRFIDVGAEQSVVGYAAFAWVRGDIRLASGRADSLPVTFTERQRKLAWAECLLELELVAPARGYLGRAGGASPVARVAEASVLVIGERALSTIVPAGTSDLVPAASLRALAESPTRQWAEDVAEAILSRVANASGRTPSRWPPLEPCTCVALLAPSHVLARLARSRAKAALLLGGSVTGLALATLLARRLTTRSAQGAG